MGSENQKEVMTLGKKISLGFTVFCIIFLSLKFTGLLDNLIEFFK